MSRRLYERRLPRNHLENAGSKHLQVAGYGQMRLLVDESDCRLQGKMQQLSLERVAYTPDLGCHNLVSAKALANMLDAPIISTRRSPLSILNTAPTTIYQDQGSLACRHSGARLIPPGKVASGGEHHTNAMGSHQILWNVSEETTLVAFHEPRVKLTGARIPCAQLLEARMRWYAAPETTDRCAERRAGQLFVNTTAPLHETLLGGNSFAML